jgi:hypothetical protein
MPNKLYNILVPIDFSGKNKWAIAKAIEIANILTAIFILYILYTRPIVAILPVETSIFTPYESHADRLNNYERIKRIGCQVF